MYEHAFAPYPGSSLLLRGCHFKGTVGQDLRFLASLDPALVLALDLLDVEQRTNGGSTDPQRPDGVATALDDVVVYAGELGLDVDSRRPNGREVRKRIRVRGGRGRTARLRGEGLKVQRVRSKDRSCYQWMDVRIDERGRKGYTGRGEGLILKGAYNISIRGVS